MKLKGIFHQSNILLLIPLVLSMFTYLWNPLGVIPLRYDEATYIGRAVHVLVAQTPQESTLYDHPYFGQLFLGGILGMIGYPNSLHPSAAGDVVNSVKMLWFVPRLLIGIIGIVDTFLVYKISERRYNTKIVFTAAILFAVMPVTFLRTVFLETLQLPFLLSSVLFALYVKDSTNIGNKRKNVSLTMLSGICMGLAIFTKIPVFMMIPLVGFLIVTNSKNIRNLGLWFIPVILIQLIWPAYAIANGELQYWWDSIYWQTHRQVENVNISGVDKQDTFSNAIIKDFIQMPILIVLGLFGLAYAAIKKDFFLLLWAIPFLVFLYFIGLVREFYIIPILPALCIAAARLVVDLLDKLANTKVHKIVSFSVISAITIFGFISFMLLLNMTNNDSKFAEVALVLRYLEESKNESISTISTHVYSWIPKYVFQLDSDYLIPEIGIEEKPQNKQVLMVVDRTFRNVLNSNDAVAKHLMKIYNEHSKEGTTTVENGINKIVIPQHWPSNLSQYGELDLTDNLHIWKPSSKVKINISQSKNNLTIVVNTNKTESVTKHAFLQTQLKNLTGTPLVLSLEYASKLPKVNTKYFVQIRDGDNQNLRYFKRDLSDTSGNLTKSMFILPSNIVDRPLQFRLGLVTNSPGEHVLRVNKASITYPASP